MTVETQNLLETIKANQIHNLAVAIANKEIDRNEFSEAVMTRFSHSEAQAICKVSNVRVKKQQSPNEAFVMSAMNLVELLKF